MWRCVNALRSVAPIGTLAVKGASPGVRNAVTTKTGALLPEPTRTPFSAIGVMAAVVPGLLLGAAISKSIANFLEENDLFVPSDDDDDDD